MNKLNELKEKAIVVEYGHGAFGERESYRVLDPDLYAELIIKEFIMLTENVSESHRIARMDTVDFGEKNRYATAEAAIKYLQKLTKDHFGVK